jgi:hypothetical protein
MYYLLGLLLVSLLSYGPVTDRPPPEGPAVEASLRADLRAGRDAPDSVRVLCWHGRYALGGDAVVVTSVTFATLRVTAADRHGRPEKRHASYLFCRGKMIAHLAVTERRRP